MLAARTRPWALADAAGRSFGAGIPIDRKVALRGGKTDAGMTFSCDGSHYIDLEDFFRRLDCFGKDG
jgi:hypothetical protein